MRQERSMTCSHTLLFLNFHVHLIESLPHVQSTYDTLKYLRYHVYNSLNWHSLWISTDTYSTPLLALSWSVIITVIFESIHSLKILHLSSPHLSSIFLSLSFFLFPPPSFFFPFLFSSSKVNRQIKGDSPIFDEGSFDHGLGISSGSRNPRTYRKGTRIVTISRNFIPIY